MFIIERSEQTILSTAKELLAMDSFWESVFFKDVALGRLTTLQSIIKHLKVYEHKVDLMGE